MVFILHSSYPYPLKLLCSSSGCRSNFKTLCDQLTETLQHLVGQAQDGWFTFKLLNL